MRTVLDTAYTYGVVVSMCLFSFDLLQNDGNKTSTQMTRNKNFLTVPANLDSYITNALRPILDAVGSHPAIMCWEVFNEPEGMSTEHGWATEKIAHSDIMRFTNKIAGEVHRRTKKMASTGIHEYSSGELSRYTDAKLKAAGGDNDGYLDFYMVHHYPEYWGASGSPFKHPASYWGMDRPILIGEFPAQSWGNGTNYTAGKANETAMTITAAFEYAYDNGYLGAMSWSMTEGNKTKFGSFTTTQPALQNLASKHEADIKVTNSGGGVVGPPPTGNLAMKLALTDLPKEGTDSDGGPWNELFIEDATHNFSGKTNFTFEMYIEPGSGTNLTIVPVVKMGDNWTWSPAASAEFSLAGKTQGQWQTITVPVSAFTPESGSPNLSQVKGIVLQYFAKDNSYTGTIYFDNVKIDNTTLYDFSDPYSQWNTAASAADVSIVARPGGSTSVRHGANTANASARAPAVSVRGKTLSVTGISSADLTVRMVDMRGKTVARFRATGGAGSFSLAKVPAGRYVVETRISGKTVGNSAVVVK
jgi:hypothetical protein